MTHLHFQPIKGKSLDIIDAILHTEEVASTGDDIGLIFETVDELVPNIVDYSNSDYLEIEIVRDDKGITLRFRDGGIPFNPLKKDPPDISLPMEEREIGGLGIFLVIKKMDVVEYEHTDGENILTVKKMIKD